MISQENPLHDTKILEPAERVSRLLASFIDGAVLLCSVIAAIPIWQLADSNLGSDNTLTLMAPFLGVAIDAVYQSYLLTVRGQTIGKRIMKIRIVRNDTEKNGGFITNCLVRSLLSILISRMVPIYSMIDALFIFTEDRKCIHDRIAGTKVIKVYADEKSPVSPGPG